MTHEPPGPPSDSYPPPSSGGYPPPPPGGYPPPPPSAGGYPPPAPGYGGGYPPPAPGYGGGYPPPGHASQGSSGSVDIPGVGAVQVASVGQRILARLIDGAIYFVVYLILMGIGVSELVSSSHSVTDQYGNTISEPSGAGMAGYFAIVGTLALVSFLYEWLMVGLVGATLGKMALSLKVVNENTGAVLGLGGSFVRWVIPFVGSFVCGIGQLVVYLSVLFDNSGRLQGWHDKMAHDLVIKRPR